MNFGLTDTEELDTIGAFLCHSVKWGSEPLVLGFANMFKGMKKAVVVYEQMKVEIHSLHIGVLAMKSEINDLKDQHTATEALAAHVAEVGRLRDRYTAPHADHFPQERCRSANANYDAALIEIARFETLAHTKDAAVRQCEAENRAMRDMLHTKDAAVRQCEAENRSLRDMLKETENLMIKASENELSLQSSLDTAKTMIRSTEQRHDALHAELQAARNRNMQLTSQPGAPFYDHNTHTAIVCPVLQSNGYIIPFKSVLSKWMAAAGPDDGYVHRTYICPVMQQPTTLASLATQDSIRHIAKHAGIDIDPPVVFSYMSDGAWTSFSFHDQLGIIAKVCAVQTMQITECVEHIVVQRNTMAVEINAVHSQVNAPAHTIARHTLNSLFRQDEGIIRIKCVAENLNTHVKYPIKATAIQCDWNPTGSIQFE